MLILLICVVILILYNAETFKNGDIYLNDQFDYQQMNYIKNDRYDPLHYNDSLDDFNKYAKYRKDYKYPKNAKYNVNATIIYKPQNCSVTKWSNWSSCSKKCGGGTQSRERMVVKPSKYGGIPCPYLRDNISCNTQSCIPYNAVRYNTSYYIKNYWGPGSYMASCGYSRSCGNNLAVATYRPTSNSYLVGSPNWSRWKLINWNGDINVNNGIVYYGDVVKMPLEANNYVLVICNNNSCNSYSSMSVSATSPKNIPNIYNVFWQIVSTTGKTGIVKLGDKIKFINWGNNSYLNTCGYTSYCGNGKFNGINTTKPNKPDSAGSTSNWSIETSI